MYFNMTNEKDTQAQNNTKWKPGFIASGISTKTLQNAIDLIVTWKFQPIVSKTFKLEAAAQAQDFLTAGGVNGKVILVVD